MKLISGLQVASGFDPSKWVIEAQDPTTNSTRKILFNDAIATEVAARLAKELTIIGNTGLDTTPATLGNLPSLAAMDYISAATSILNACELLDIALKATNDAAIMHTSVNLTNAELLNLLTTPKVLLNAPGSGKYIFPISVSLKLNYGSSPLLDNSATVWVSMPGVIETLLFQDVYDTLTQSETNRQIMKPYFTSSPLPRLYENQPLILYSSINFTGGVGCTAMVDIIYKILPW